MKMAYVLPQVQVFQDFRVIPTAVTQNLNAFIFGPQYQLFRYAQAAEKALIGLGAYDNDDDTDYSYPSQPAGSSIDLTYVKLYMENVWAEYLNIPASAANPIVVKNNSEWNKLRAAPVIGSAQRGMNGASEMTGVIMASGGYFTNDETLPDDFFIYPIGGNVGGVWSANGYISNAVTQASKLAYVSRSGLSGTTDVTAAFTAWKTGAEGMKYLLSAGVDSKLRSKLVAKIANSGGGTYFTITPNLANVIDFIDWAIDGLTPLKLDVDLDSISASSVAWSSATKTITIRSQQYAEYTMAGLRTALRNDPDIAAYCTISDFTGTGTTDIVDSIKDSAETPVSIDGLTTVMFRDVFRIRVTANPYIFVTGNGFNHTVQFKGRDVQVGDRIRYQVTDGSSVVHNGTTEIVGFEADQTAADIDDVSPKASNQATQAGDDISSGLVDIVAGVDNVCAFDGVNTKLFSLSAVVDYYPGDLLNGLVADSFIVTITKAGAKGVAEATVSNVSGTYYREAVLIEASGSDDGQIYIGQNMYINLDAGAGDPDSNFHVGDVYTISPDVEAPFTVIDDTVALAAGAYDGPSDTTYVIEVTRGGVFTRAVNATDGLQVTGGTVFTPTMDWSAWTAGEVNDEYILRCTQAGMIGNAEFAIDSLLGDSETGIKFLSIVNSVTLGNRGLSGSFDTDVSFNVGDYWVIRVNAARPQIRISDSAGIDQGSLITVNYNSIYDLGDYGATIEFLANADTEAGFCTNGGLRKGDIFYVAAEASVDGAIRTLVLADDMPSAVTPGETSGVTNAQPNLFNVKLHLVQATTEITQKKVQSPPDYNWEPAAAEVTVNEAIAVQDSSWYESDGSLPWLPIYTADMYLEYRALMATYASNIQSITDIGDVETTLGTITPDNPLAQGVFNALSNSGDREVYYMATPTDDLAGYLSVLDRASLSSDVYAFTPLSRNSTIIGAVESHINDMSSEQNKRWRIGFVGSTMPTDVAVYHKANNPGNVEYYAEIVDDPSTVGTQYTLVQFVTAGGAPSPYTHVRADVHVGDKVRINYSTDAWGDATYDEYTVASWVSNTALKLAVGPVAGIPIPTKVEVWHDYSIQEMADAVAAISSGYANRRIYNVFPAQLVSAGVVETAEFGAAAIAGLCSSVAPQQGLTNIEVNGFDDLPLVYSTFSRAQLNKMAEYGTLIIMQDIAGGEIYVRHQVSTASLAGNINTTELSVTKNLDSISYYFAARLAPFIGKYNITPQLIDVIRAQIADGIMYLGAFTKVGLLGPQLVLENTEIVTVEQHPTLADHIVAIVNVGMPYPLNVIELHLVV